MALSFYAVLQLAMIEVLADAATPARGHVRWRDGEAPCALGPRGIRRDKREGDGATPAGVFALRRLLYRADRGPRPPTFLPAIALAEDDGWCDAPRDLAYNTQIKLPFDASHENLWRADGLYDLLIVIGHNDDPVVAHAGSAIFLHLAREDFAPTHGCVAMRRVDLVALLAQIGRSTLLKIGDA